MAVEIGGVIWYFLHSHQGVAGVTKLEIPQTLPIFGSLRLCRFLPRTTNLLTPRAQ